MFSEREAAIKHNHWCEIECEICECSSVNSLNRSRSASTEPSALQHPQDRDYSVYPVRYVTDSPGPKQSTESPATLSIERTPGMYAMPETDPQFRDGWGASSIPTDCRYEVTTSGGPLESRMTEYPL